MPRTGRPKTITKATEKIIVGCFTNGLTDDETAYYCGISRKSIQRMRAGDLCPAIKTATLAKKMFYVRTLRDGHRKDWPRLAWYLERTYPNQYCRPEVALQITQNTLNQTTNNALIISAEVADQMFSRVKVANDKVNEMFKGRPGNGSQSDDG